VRLEYEGKEDNFSFLEASELRRTIESNAQCVKDCKEQLAQGRWSGNLTYAQALDKLVTGDQSLVAQSDELLSKLEDKLPQTSKWQKINHYTGTRVSVTRHLAGLPKSMRKRTRLDRDDAPVTIFMDLTSSAMVDADHLLKRGIAILAFTRLLTQHRPVELWGGVSLGDPRSYSGKGQAWSSTVGWRIDTAPLDLARAAFLLAHPAVARGIGYGIGPALAGHATWGGSWPWGDNRLSMSTLQSRLRNALGAAEMLCIPAIYGTDPLVTDPIAWITRELERLTGHGAEVGSEDWNKEQV